MTQHSTMYRSLAQSGGRVQHGEVAPRLAIALARPSRKKITFEVCCPGDTSVASLIDASAAQPEMRRNPKPIPKTTKTTCIQTPKTYTLKWFQQPRS